MKPRKLKLFNGGDWACRGGHLYVCAYSQQDAVDLANQAYRKIKGYEDRPDICPFTIGHVRVYWAKGCWGNPMAGIVPERGVWWRKQAYGPDRTDPVRVM